MLRLSENINISYPQTKQENKTFKYISPKLPFKPFFMASLLQLWDLASLYPTAALFQVTDLCSKMENEHMVLFHVESKLHF